MGAAPTGGAAGCGRCNCRSSPMRPAWVLPFLSAGPQDFHGPTALFGPCSHLKTEGCRPFGCKSVLLMLLQEVEWGSCSGSERLGHAQDLGSVALGSIS